jgi:hypothetical protein
MSIVWRCVAKRSFASSSATVADGSPASLRTALGVVLHAGSTARAARMRVRSIAATCYPIRVLTLFSAFRTVPRSFVRPSYHASVPYSSDGSTHVVTTLRMGSVAGVCEAS